MTIDAVKLVEAEEAGRDAAKSGLSFWDNPHMLRPFEESWLEQDSWAKGWQREAGNPYRRASKGW